MITDKYMKKFVKSLDQKKILKSELNKIFTLCTKNYFIIDISKPFFIALYNNV